MDTSQNTFYEPNDLLRLAACTWIVLYWWLYYGGLLQTNWGWNTGRCTKLREGGGRKGSRKLCRCQSRQNLVQWQCINSTIRRGDIVSLWACEPANLRTREPTISQTKPKPKPNPKPSLPFPSLNPLPLNPPSPKFSKSKRAKKKHHQTNQLRSY